MIWDHNYTPIIYPLYMIYLKWSWWPSGFLQSEAMDENGPLRMIYRVKKCRLAMGI